ncbi:hydroxymethylglutaryl-CoA reductase [Portibacter lacus]|uniref:hydroxymethylglutaryl-CoA reductase (NADPH) n=1 Tax=Portibacter lacus TaxID=1099794 RepID=A0AA37WFI7_9BACT|nr:hydroxymethylglutaryl-CoA reductase [Portibacter lacus]GLR18672.1 3-hydroxy-3-methylglutaryl-CoA reductase [Portibacter lacus]
MSTDYRNLKILMQEIEDDKRIQRIIQQQNQDHELERIWNRDHYNKEGQDKRLDYLKEKHNLPFENLSNNAGIDDLNELKGNIENFIGFSKVPTGIAGPLLVNGTAASGQFFIPLATTEGALVASYNRGCKAASISGGIRSICITESVQRSPIFKFENIIGVGQFLAWVVHQYEKFEEITSKSSNYAKLRNLKTNIEGNQVNLIFEFNTGDAAGQNMVTFCTSEICSYIIENTPIKPKVWYVESNLSGDKKSNYQSFQNVRGKKVVSEVEIPREVVEKTLRSTPEMMADYWQTSTVSLIQLGSIGAQGHIANGLTALFIATGQDVACISEVIVAVNRMEVTENGNLYASLTMPNLIVGTVGGGTSLPTQRECLEIMECYGAGKARKFAEICCALALAGELSICAAIASGHFVSAHQKLGR